LRPTPSRQRCAVVIDFLKEKDTGGIFILSLNSRKAHQNIEPIEIQLVKLPIVSKA